MKNLEIREKILPVELFKEEKKKNLSWLPQLTKMSKIYYRISSGRFKNTLAKI